MILTETSNTAAAAAAATDDDYDSSSQRRVTSFILSSCAYCIQYFRTLLNSITVI